VGDRRLSGLEPLTSRAGAARNPCIDAPNMEAVVELLPTD
jgi:hypothetical protein